jgi:hypothetical protein
VSGRLVTVLINNYNYARFLPDAVESALAQTHADVEIVVVDDGSTDGSRELLGRWAGRIRTVLKENGGQASALNAGWAAARGELVLLLDADDVLLPDTAARALAAHAPGTATVRYPVAMVDADRRPLGRTLPAGPLPSGDLAPRVLAGERCPAPPTSGTALDRVLADPLFPIPEDDWRISADAYLALLAPLAGRVATLSDPGALYRVHGDNRWLLAGGVSPDWVRAQIRLDRQREAALRSAAASGRAAIPDGWLECDPEHLQFRLSSLRLDPAGHPHPHSHPRREPPADPPREPLADPPREPHPHSRRDTRRRLALLGARAALRTRGYRWRKRVLYALWFLLTALAPGRGAVALIEMGFRARPRPRLPWFTRRGSSDAHGALR